MVYLFFAYVLVPAVVLAIVIFVHEGGHFLVARHFGAQVPVFSVGFGREIWGRTDGRGTRWKISVFPFGGYVSLVGLDDLPLRHRVLITLGGPMANFIFAVLVMFIVFVSYGAPATPPHIVGVNIAGGAHAAGLVPGDVVRTIDGVDVPQDMDGIKDIIRGVKADYIAVVVDRGGDNMVFDVPMRALRQTGDFGEDDTHPMLGVVFAGQNLKLSAINKVGDVVTEGNVGLARSEILRYGGRLVVINFGMGDDRGDFLVRIDKKLNAGLLDSRSADYSNLVLWDYRDTRFYPMSVSRSVVASFDLLYQGVRKTVGVIYQIVVGRKDTRDLGGVVAISSMSGEVAQTAAVIGPYFLFKLVVLLSINIGFINLLPFPMLDGGHLVFQGIEAVRGKPPSPKVKGYVYGVGVMFILAVVLLANYHDIAAALLGH